MPVTVSPLRTAMVHSPRTSAAHQHSATQRTASLQRHTPRIVVIFRAFLLQKAKKKDKKRTERQEFEFEASQ